MFKNIIILFLLFIMQPMHAQEQQYTRLKGYYRVYQSTNSMLTFFVDGLMEFYIPQSATTVEASKEKKGLPFVERKFLGERRRKAPKSNGDDTFVRMALPNLERITLLESIDSEEYSTRNNGDVYRWADKCGKISKEKRKINGQPDFVTTIELDELIGQPNHEIDMSQLRMYGIVARMTQFEESESYLSNNLLLASQKHQTLFAHYRGEDDDERIDVWSEFYVSDRMTITESELKRIKKEKNSVWTFSIPSVVPPLDKEVAEAWTKMVEY
ncbi:hypothetical protein [Prevotella sp.]